MCAFNCHHFSTGEFSFEVRVTRYGEPIFFIHGVNDPIEGNPNYLLRYVLSDIRNFDEYHVFNYMLCQVLRKK